MRNAVVCTRHCRPYPGFHTPATVAAVPRRCVRLHHRRPVYVRRLHTHVLHVGVCSPTERERGPAEAARMKGETGEIRDREIRRRQVNGERECKRIRTRVIAKRARALREPDAEGN